MDWFIFATGPSFRRRDAELLKGAGYSVAVNNAVFYTPWADCLYACDRKWWEYYDDGLTWYKGRRVSYQAYADNQVFKKSPLFRNHGGNSGHQALQFAAASGASRVCLLGFDQKHTGGVKHCHSDHPADLGNAQNIDHYPRFMDATAGDLERLGVEVFNLSRDTALTCFRRMTPEDYVERYL